jgi:uncharacterized membrane protein
MSPAQRRWLYVLAFEGVGIVLAGSGLAALSGRDLQATGSFALASTLIATAWNFLYTTGFEAWESRQARRGRSLRRRAAQALGLEAGIVIVLTPLMSIWLGLPFAEALVYQLTMTAAFLLYAFLFNLAFDMAFGLPRSARP